MSLGTAWQDQIVTPMGARPESRWPLILDNILTLSIGLLAVVAVSSSILTARWVRSMPSLTLVAILALLLGYAATAIPVRDTFRRWMLALGIGLVPGAAVSILTTLTALQVEGWGERWNLFRDRMTAWFDIVVHGGVSDDPIPFILLVVTITWLVSYGFAWSLFILRNAWVALIPLGIVVIFNNAYRPVEFDWAIMFFLFAALLLIARVAFQRQQEEWRRTESEVPDYLNMRAFLQTLLVVSAVIFAVWLLPSRAGDQIFGPVWTRVTAPLNDRLFDSGRFFAGLRGSQDRAFRDFGRTLPLRGSITLDETEILKVTGFSTYIPFLRVTAYEQYSSNGWTNPAHGDSSIAGSSVPSPSTVSAATSASAPIDTILRRLSVSPDIQRAMVGSGTVLPPISVEIEAIQKLDRLAVPGAPYAVSVDSNAQLPPTPSFNVPLTGAAPTGTPAELLTALPRLQQQFRTNSGTKAQDYSALLPPGYQPESVQTNPPTLIVERIPTLPDALSLETRRDLKPGDSYLVFSVDANASESRLRAAGARYPAHVIPFTQLPEDFPPSVRFLAGRLTANASTPYDAALAIETYLRLIPYDEKIPSPEPGTDRVERFLFEIRRGYFDYHASAMTVMLRSLGIPARLASGYAVRERLKEGQYLIREKHIYSWPEVYFPGIGWVQFSPTPNFPLVNRPLDPASEGGPVAAGPDQADIDPDFGADEEILPDSAVGTALDEAGRGFNTTPWLITIGFIALIVLASRVVWERTLAGLPVQARLWEKTRRLSIAAGMGPQEEQTPREFAARADGDIGTAGRISRLARAYERSRYGSAPDIDTDERKALQQDYRAVRRQLLKRLAGRLRWQMPRLGRRR